MGVEDREESKVEGGKSEHRKNYLLTARKVPQGHCWVIGDNLDYSRDSRHWGPLPMALIRGKIIGKVFPWSERRWVVNDLEK